MVLGQVCIQLISPQNLRTKLYPNIKISAYIWEPPLQMRDRHSAHDAFQSQCLYLSNLHKLVWVVVPIEKRLLAENLYAGTQSWSIITMSMCNIPSPGKQIKMIKPVIYTRRLFFRYMDVQTSETQNNMTSGKTLRMLRRSGLTMPANMHPKLHMSRE